MPGTTPHSPDDLEREASWLSSLPMQFSGFVRDLLPEFTAYARVLHPPGNGSTWASVASANNKVAHASMQWDCIQPEGDDGEPWVGRIDETIIRALERALGSRALFGAVWIGWGRDASKVEGPRALRPHREYVVVGGDWSSFTAFDFPPAFLWDTTHEWMTSTGVDLDSTVIGGSEQFVAEILRDSSVESWIIHPSDSLQLDGDHLNC